MNHNNSNVISHRASEFPLFFPKYKQRILINVLKLDSVKICVYNVDSVKMNGGKSMPTKLKQSYHHKDLRNALIEKGIEIVNAEGVHAFSLRKVAAACGVSHAAPYRITYVSFFVENPAYFQFLYSQSNIKIDLSLSISDKENYKPYIIYKDVVNKLLEQVHYPLEQRNDIIITIWAFIHGITSLATMNNV